MNINFEHTITAPASFKKDKNAISVYLTAFGITLISFFIFIPLQIISQISFFLIPEDVTYYNFILILVSNVLYGTLLPFILNIPVLILPTGYVAETIKRELHNKVHIMPLWKGHWKLFFFNGLKILGILLSYFIFLALFIGISLQTLNFVTITTSYIVPQITPIINIVASLLITLGSIFFVVVILLSSPFIIIRAIEQNSFIAGFNIIAVWKKIFLHKKDYFIAIILVIFIIITLIVKVLGLICSLVGILLIPLVTEFIIPIIIMNLFTQIYKIGLNKEIQAL